MIFQTAHEFTAFLGPIGGPEIIVIFVVLVLLAVPVVIVVLLVMYSKSQSKSSQSINLPASVQSRLAEIDALRSKNVISSGEYEEKRKKIIGDI